MVFDRDSDSRSYKWLFLTSRLSMNDICLSAERLCLKVDVLAAKRRCFVWLSAEKRYCNFVNFCRENSNLWKVNQTGSFAVREFGFTRGLRTEEHFHTCFHFLWFFLIFWPPTPQFGGSDDDESHFLHFLSLMCTALLVNFSFFWAVKNGVTECLRAVSINCSFLKLSTLLMGLRRRDDRMGSEKWKRVRTGWWTANPR